MPETSPAVELVRCPSLTDQVPYAYASVVGEGRLVFTAGACPLDEEGEVVAPGDVTAQAQRVVANLREALAAAGCGLTDVARAQLKQRWGTMQKVLSAQDRLEKIVSDGASRIDRTSSVGTVTSCE